MNNFEQAMLYAQTASWHEAVACLEKAKKDRPNCVATHCMLAIGLLKIGRITEGLQNFEWRFGRLETNDHPMFEIPIKTRERYKAPYWDGKADLTGKTILVFNEGGHGDMLQNVRYLPELKKRGARVILEAKQCLCQLLEGVEGIDELRPCNNSKFKMIFLERVKQTGIDYVLSAWSLLLYFDPELNNIPWKFPYITPKESECEAVKLVRDCTAKVKIGIIWAGIHGHGNDYHRSMFKKEFQPLKEIDSVQLFSLQKGEMTRRWLCGEVNLLDGADLEDIDLGPMLNTFNDTAAVVKELDAVVSVDTSVAHMAGAMNAPVWMALPVEPWAEWRWQKNWYSSQRKIYQDVVDDWKPVIRKIAEEIKQEAK